MDFHDVVNKARRFVGDEKSWASRHAGPDGDRCSSTADRARNASCPVFGKADKVTKALSNSVTPRIHTTRRVSRPPKANRSRSTRQRYRRTTNEFQGRIQQIPPPVSAKKIQGTPAYKLAREKFEVKLEPVEVEIYSIEILRCEGDEIDIRVHCGTGTYLRSIAHDLGQDSWDWSFLKRLRRTASGGFDLQMSRTLEQTRCVGKRAVSPKL